MLTPTRARACVTASSEPSPADRRALEAVSKLRAGDLDEAESSLQAARRAYAVSGGPTDSQVALLDEIASRIDAARSAAAVAATAAARTAAANSPGAATVYARLEGDDVLQEALRLFNAKEYGRAREEVQRARALFEAAGVEVARDRESQVGNLYSLISREEERQAHLKKLTKLKRIKEMKDQQKKRGGPPPRPMM